MVAAIERHFPFRVQGLHGTPTIFDFLIAEGLKYVGRRFLFTPETFSLSIFFGAA